MLSLSDPRFVNDYGLPTMAHRQLNQDDIKIEEFAEEDEGPPSMVGLSSRRPTLEFS